MHAIARLGEHSVTWKRNVCLNIRISKSANASIFKPLEKANQNRPNKNKKKVTFIENEIYDNDNAWETVGATKSMKSIKTRTAVNTCAKATQTKGQKVIENKNQKKQTRQKSTVEKSTKIDKNNNQIKRI